MWKRFQKRHEGYVFLITLGAMAFLMLQVGISFGRVRGLLTIEYANYRQQRALYQANAGLEDGIAQVLAQLKNGTALTGGTCLKFQAEPSDCYALSFTAGSQLATIVTATGQAGPITRRLTVVVNPQSGIPPHYQVFSRLFYVGSNYTTPNWVQWGDGTATYDAMFVNGNVIATRNTNNSYSVQPNYLRASGSVAGTGVNSATLQYQAPLALPTMAWYNLSWQPTTWAHVSCAAPCTLTGALSYANPTVVYVTGNLVLNKVAVTGTVAYVATGTTIVDGQLTGSTAGVFSQGDITLRNTTGGTGAFNGLFYSPGKLLGQVDGTLTGVVVVADANGMAGKTKPFVFLATTTLPSTFQPIVALAGPLAGLNWVAP